MSFEVATPSSAARATWGAIANRPCEFRDKFIQVAETGRCGNHNVT